MRPDYFSRPMERKDHELTAADIKTVEDLKTQFLGMHKDIKTFVEKANQEIKDTGKASAETKSAIGSLTEAINTLGTRIDKVEAKGNRDGEGGLDQKSLGDRFVESAEWKDAHGLAKVAKARFELKTITNAQGQNQPLVPDMRVPGIQMLPNRRLRIRQLLATGQTSSNLVQYVKENLFTNNAGPQTDGASPTVAGEGGLKPQSDITFTLANAPVVTLAHWILASRQVLDDAPMLASYINGRLQYGLALEEESQILNGQGNPGEISGLMANATGYNRATTGTKLDWLRRAITQLQISEFDAEFVVLNPADWEGIELTKDSQNRYIVADPQQILGPQIWGLPVVATNSMNSGNFLVANGSMAAQIWDRQSAAVEVSREDSDNFRRNLVTLLCEERLALTVYRSAALIKGVFSV